MVAQFNAPLLLFCGVVVVVAEVFGRHVGRLPGLALQLVRRHAHDAECADGADVLLELLGELLGNVRLHSQEQEVKGDHHEVWRRGRRVTHLGGDFHIDPDVGRVDGLGLQELQSTPLAALGVPAAHRARLLADVVDLPFGVPDADRTGLHRDFGILLDHCGRPLGLFILPPDLLSLTPERVLVLLPCQLHELGKAGPLVRVARLVAVRVGTASALFAVAVALRYGTGAPVVGHRLRLGDVLDVHVADGGQQVHAVRPFSSS